MSFITMLATSIGKNLEVFSRVKIPNNWPISGGSSLFDITNGAVGEVGLRLPALTIATDPLDLVLGLLAIPVVEDPLLHSYLTARLLR